MQDPEGHDEEGVDAIASLEQMLRDCRALLDVDLILVTGGVADDGSAEGCRQVRDRIGALAAEYGAEHDYTTGNHDRRPDSASRRLLVTVLRPWDGFRASWSSAVTATAMNAADRTSAG